MQFFTIFSAAISYIIAIFSRMFRKNKLDVILKPARNVRRFRDSIAAKRQVADVVWYKQRRSKFGSVLHDSGKDGQYLTYRAQLAENFRKRLRHDVTALTFKRMTRHQYDAYIDLLTKSGII